MGATPQTLSTSELAWLRVQTPESLSQSTVTLMVNGTVDAACLRARLEDRLLSHERFRQRIEQPHLPLSRPKWQDCHEFHLTDHFIELETAADRGHSGLEDIVARLRTEPLDPRLPLWQVHLVHLPERSSAVILRVHAALADCTAVPTLALQLLDDGAAATPPSDSESTLPLSARLALEQAGNAAAATRTLCRLITSRADRDNPLRCPVGPNKDIAWSAPVDLEKVEMSGDASGHPLGVPLIAAVTAALRRTVHRLDRPTEDVELRAVIPWSLRRPGEPPIGSRLALGLLALPIDRSKAVDRRAEIRRHLERLLLVQEDVVVLGTDPRLALTMTEIEERSLRLLGHKATLSVGIVAGPYRSSQICDQPVRGLFWSPAQPGGTALTIGAIIYAGAVQFEVACDRNLEIEAALLAADLAAALDAA